MLDKYFTAIGTPSGCRTYQCRLCGETFLMQIDAGGTIWKHIKQY